MRRPELASGPWTQERSLKFAALLMLSFKNNLVPVGTACPFCSSPRQARYTGLISFIFSSLLLFDLPGITEGVASLRRSRLRRPYELARGSARLASSSARARRSRPSSPSSPRRL